jgi:hypothetical protein
VKYFEYPIGKIETNDPEDEGLYQCIARNDYGDAVNSIYLHIRKRQLLDNVPQDAQCYPMNGNDVFVTYRQETHDNMIQYIVAADNPRQFLPKIINNLAPENFKIEHASADLANIVRPLRKFYLYMRNMSPQKTENINSDNIKINMLMSRLSKPIVCAAQGFKPNFIKSNKGIFFTWDVSEVIDVITYFTIQFRNDEGDPSFTFANLIIGTNISSPTYSPDNAESLIKIPIKSSRNIEENGVKWLEIQIPGETTGIFVVNVQSLSVRILGSTNPDGSLFDQDLSRLEWYTISSTDISIELITVADVEPRSVLIRWSHFDGVKCAKVCAQKKQTSIVRDTSKSNFCETM